MSIIIRPFNDTDWQYLLAIINQTTPGFETENRKLFDYIQRFDTTFYSRRQYVAENDLNIIAYGALQQSREKENFRLELYMPPNLIETAGVLLYNQIERDVHDFPISSLWARAYSFKMESFLKGYGFKFFSFRTLSDEKTPMITLKKDLVSK